MDPLGFALEHYDAVGRYRETDGGATIDSQIKYQGHNVTSPKDFRDALLGLGDEFVRTVSEKLTTYALGRGLNTDDAPLVRQLVRNLKQSEYKWSTLVFSIVKSDQFQMRAAPVAAQTSTATAAQN